MDDTAISVQPDDAITPTPCSSPELFQTATLPPQHSYSSPSSPPLLPPSLVTDTCTCTSNQENTSMDLLLRVKRDANSRRNFTLKQAEKLFFSEEQRSSNCKGKRGKSQLNKTKLQYIKENTFKFWPLEIDGDEERAWKNCRKAIGEGGRQLNFKLRLSGTN